MRAPPDEEAESMRGQLLWFNGVKDCGVIRTEEGERLYVHRTGFEPGHVPEGRCAGTPVSFARQAATRDEPARALAVTTVAEPERGRARARRQHR